MNYQDKYLTSFDQGLKGSHFKVGQANVSVDNFFESLVGKTGEAKSSGGRIFFCGNGASAAFANHMALDWSKNGKINAYSLSDSALLTALSNDYSYEEALVEYLKIENLGPNDIVATISSSGNSPNVVNALNYAIEVQSITVGFSGLKPDNKTQQIVEYSLYVPLKTYGMVECAHQLFLHLWLDMYMGITEWEREETQNMNSKSFKL